jgi:tetratricopeptide (TPR) repeat protein
MGTLINAKDWAGLADWFETVSPAVRGKYYEWWLTSLNRSQRWARLAVVCEALQPLLEAKSGPRMGTCRLYRASALTNLGRHAEAAAAHMENWRLGYREGFVNACSEAQLAEDWTNLLTWSEEQLQKNPGHAAGNAWKGEALAHLERRDEAVTFLRAAVAEDPMLAYAWNNLGHCLNEQKAWTEACEALDKALALEPRQIESLINRGKARFELRRFKESRDDFQAALALRPGDPVLTENLHQAERYAALPAPASKMR